MTQTSVDTSVGQTHFDQASSLIAAEPLPLGAHNAQQAHSPVADADPLAPALAVRPRDIVFMALAVGAAGLSAAVLVCGAGPNGAEWVTTLPIIAHP